MESRIESRTVRLSVILLVGLLVVGTLLLAACNGGTTTTTAASTQTSVTTPGETSTSQAATTPKSGGTLRIASPSPGANIGWPATLNGGGVFVQGYYETLLRSDEKGNLVPWLAESYKVADDLKSITFTIRKGVKFSDGSDLTADVVKWNLDQYATLPGGAPVAGPPAGAPPAGAAPAGAAPAGAPPAGAAPAGAPPAGAAPAGAPPAGAAPAGAPPAGAAPAGAPPAGAAPAGAAPAGAPPAGAAPAGPPPAGPSRVEVVDPYTVRVTIEAWDSTIPAAFGDNEPALYIVSKAAFDKNGKDSITTNPVGTGPFTVASYTTDSSAKLVKNPNYWAVDASGNKLPYLDELDYTFASDAATAQIMASAGELDMILDTFSGKQLADYKNMGWRVNRAYNSNDVWVPDSAHADSPWSKLEVREAAEYAVDRVTIAEKFGYGFIQAPNQIPPRDTTAYDANYALDRKYDPAKAKELLTQAGYADGFKTTLIVWAGGNKDIALAEQQYLAAVGIQAQIEFPDAAKFNSYVGPQGQYHNALLEGPDPAQGPTGLGCVSFAVFLFGNNMQQPPELTQALGAATAALTPDVSLIRAATDIVTKNALMIPIYEVGTGRVDQQYVVADFGKRGQPSFSSLETAWLNK